MEAAFEDKESCKAVKQMDFVRCGVRRRSRRTLNITMVHPGARHFVHHRRRNVMSIESVNCEIQAVICCGTSIYTLFGIRRPDDGRNGNTISRTRGRQGISFYDFPHIKDTKEFIETWYTEANQLTSDQERAALVDEANRVFSLNIGVFDELEGVLLVRSGNLRWLRSWRGSWKQTLCFERR